MTRYILIDSFSIFLLGFYLQEKGDIAFLNENTVLDYANNTNDFELLCPAKTGDLTLTLSESKARAIVIFPCLRFTLCKKSFIWFGGLRIKNYSSKFSRMRISKHERVWSLGLSIEYNVL